MGSTFDCIKIKEWKESESMLANEYQTKKPFPFRIFYVRPVVFEFFICSQYNPIQINI